MSIFSPFSVLIDQDWELWLNGVPQSYSSIGREEMKMSEISASLIGYHRLEIFHTNGSILLSQQLNVVCNDSDVVIAHIYQRADSGGARVLFLMTDSNSRTCTNKNRVFTALFVSDHSYVCTAVFDDSEPPFNFVCFVPMPSGTL